MEYTVSLTSFFQKELSSLSAPEPVKAYIVSIFSKYKSSESDLSTESITLLFSKAKFDQDFEKFQNIGDYIFFLNSVFPEGLNSASKDYYYQLAQISYWNCYKKIRWHLYEELSDRFVELSDNTRKIIRRF